MKQVRFDTPRQSDPRLNTQDVRLIDDDTLEPRPARPVAPLRVAAPELHTESLYTLSPVQHYEVREPSPRPAITIVHPPMTEKRMSAPTLDLELSRLEGDSFTMNDVRQLSADQVLSGADNPRTIVDNSKATDSYDKVNRHRYILKQNQGVNDKVFPKFTPTLTATQYSGSSNVNPVKTNIAIPNILPYQFSRKDFNTCLSKHCNCHECAKKFEADNFNHVRNNVSYQTRDVAPCHCNNPCSDVLEPSLYSPPKRNKPPSHIMNTCHIACHHSSMQHCFPSQYTSHLPPKNHTKPFEKELDHHKMQSALEKPQNVTKEPQEPTVTDLFKIIQMQNDQLQILQSQVDKLVSCQNKILDANMTFRPMQNFVQERVQFETVDKNHHKISIGVMTSFEVVKSKERLAKNSQIQCDRSQVSIREDDEKSEQGNGNFLDGILPVNRESLDDERTILDNNESASKAKSDDNHCEQNGLHNDKGNEDRILNEFSLFNLNLDNADTPQMSPDQSICVDVKDYSDSENDDHSEVGWTYYNKVMSHVNNILQESAVPSSAGALHRRAVHATRQDNAGFRLDHTNVSITKRVTFDEHAGPAACCGTTDTSLQINRLATKYGVRRSRAPSAHDEVSVATRRYMQRHHLMQDADFSPPAVPSRILVDLTALKQQPKLLVTKKPLRQAMIACLSAHPPAI